MSIFVRLVEKVTGRPHQHHNADMVSHATTRLLAAADNFSRQIKPYSEANDPLTMLFNDIREQRKTSEGGDGNRNSGPKLFS